MRGIKQDPIERFWTFVDQTETCWLWTGSLDGYGYGVLSVNRRPTRAHRFAYVTLVGEIPEGLELDHLCRVRRCCNPTHVEPVTRLENVRRGIVAQVNRERRLAETHCRNGHEYTPENVRTNKSTGHRVCRACRKAVMAAWRKRNAA